MLKCHHGRQIFVSDIRSITRLVWNMIRANLRVMNRTPLGGCEINTREIKRRFNVCSESRDCRTG